MITLEEYSTTKEQLHQQQQDSEVNVLGGFMPNDPDLFINEAKAEKFAEVGSIPKTPIMFDQWDTLFLNQFPPEFYRQALVWRYREGLIMAAEMIERGQPIPEDANVKFSTRGKRSKDQNVSAQRGEGEAWFHVKTFIQPLYEKLTKKRNLQLLAESDYADKTAYEKKFGNYGFDLSDRHQDKSGHWHAKNFNFMTEEAAKKIIAEWRMAIATGFLHHPEDEHVQTAVKGAKASYQNWGGGHNPQEHNAMVDWQGNLIDAAHRGENQGTYTMTHGAETAIALAKQLGLNVSPDGKVVYKYRKGDKVVEQAHEMPVLLPGYLIPTGVVHGYQNRVKNLQFYKSKMQEEPQNASWKTAYEETINNHKKVMEKMPRKTAFQWNVSRYNLSTKPVKVKNPDGTEQILHVRKYRTMYANHDSMAATTPTKMHQERIEGSKEAKDVLKKWFLDGGTKDGRSMEDEWRVLIPPGVRIEANVPVEGVQIKNPVQAGVDLFMDFLSGSATHGEVYPILMQMYGDVLNFTNTRLLALAGEPMLQTFAQQIAPLGKNAKNVHKWPEELKASWQSIYNFLLSRSRAYASQLAQIDLGAGTRRDRESRAARMDMLRQIEPSITDPKQKETVGKWKQQWQLSPEEQAQFQKTVGIAPGSGIRHDARQAPDRGWPGHEVGGPRPDSTKLVQFAHSFEELNKKRAAQISQGQKTRHEGAKSLDLEGLKESIKQELTLRYAMYDDYFFYDVLNQMMQGVPEDKVDAVHAKNYAIERTKADLKSSGVRVANIENIKVKGLSKSDEAHKNRILKDLKGEMRPKATLKPAFGNEKVMGLGDDQNYINWLAKSPQWMKSAEDKIKSMGIENDTLHPLVKAVNKAKKVMQQRPPQPQVPQAAPTQPSQDWLFPGLENMALTKKKNAKP
jgi:hypothetical protein